MKKKLSLLLLCFYSCCFYSQQKNGSVIIDSILKRLPHIKADTGIIDALLDISTRYQKIDPNKGLYYGKKSLQKTVTLKWNEGIAMSLCSIAENYLILGESDKAFKNSTSALALTKNKKTTSNIYRNLGKAYRSRADYSKALEYFFMALSLSEELKDSTNIAKTLNHIGSIYYYRDDEGSFDKALSYYNKSLQLNTKLKIKLGMIDVLQNMGILYSDSGKDSIALSYYAKALKLCLEENDQIGIILNYFSVGKLYINTNHLKKALPYIIEAKLMAKKINNNRYYSIAINSEADIYIKMATAANNPEKDELLNKAELLLQEALALSKQTNNLLNLSRHYEYFSKLYALKGDYKKSKEAYIMYSDYRDSMYSISSRETIKNLEDQRTIELKNKEIELHKISLDLKEKQKWYFIGGIVLFGIIGILLFYQNRNRKKINKTLRVLNSELDEANKTKTRFFSILNHDLRGPVSNLIHFLHLKNDSPELLTEELKKEMENKTILATENLLVSMEDLLFWSKGQMQNFKPVPQRISIDQLFEDLRNHFLSFENIRIEFQNPQNIYFISDPDYLKTIMRNLTGNSLKALEKNIDPIIVWKAGQENNHIYLSITDNGPGGTQQQFKALYDETEVVGIKTGLGLHLIRDLAKAINCKINVESKVSGGTTIRLEFD